MMVARYVPAACCWRVFFGGSLTSIRDSRFWPSKGWLKADLKAAGLKMDDETGVITVAEDC